MQLTDVNKWNLLESVTEKVLKQVNSFSPYRALHTPDCKIQFKQLASSGFLRGFPAVYEDLTDNKKKDKRKQRTRESEG